MIKINLEEYNNILISFKLLLRVTSISKNEVIFNNGRILSTEADVRKFRRRVNGNSVEYIKRFDLIYGTDKNISVENEKQAKRINSSNGGYAVWNSSREILTEKFKGRIPVNKGIAGVYKFGPRTKEVKDKISKKNSGVNNGMYGIKMSEEDKINRSKIMKDKILAGEFTPNSNNRNTHWSSTFNNNRYRSSWEALYQYINPDAEYETLRIEYKLSHNTYIYIVDFIDHNKKVVVEIKPRELCNGEKFNAKIAALHNWATLHNYTVLVVDKDWFMLQSINIDYTKFDKLTADKIKKIYETNK